jgi:hypothetical protein
VLVQPVGGGGAADLRAGRADGRRFSAVRRDCELVARALPWLGILRDRCDGLSLLLHCPQRPADLTGVRG